MKHINPLKWLASLGTGAVSSLFLWLLSLAGLSEGKTSPLLWIFLIAVVSKAVNWVVANRPPKAVVALTAKYQPKKVQRKRGPRRPLVAGDDLIARRKEADRLRNIGIDQQGKAWPPA